MQCSRLSTALLTARPCSCLPPCSPPDSSDFVRNDQLLSWISSRLPPSAGGTAASGGTRGGASSATGSGTGGRATPTSAAGTVLPLEPSSAATDSAATAGAGAGGLLGKEVGAASRASRASTWAPGTPKLMDIQPFEISFLELRMEAAIGAPSWRAAVLAPRCAGCLVRPVCALQRLAVGAVAGAPPLLHPSALRFCHSPFSLLPPAGKGSFGKVYLASWNETPVAVKVLMQLEAGGGSGGGEEQPVTLSSPAMAGLYKGGRTWAGLFSLPLVWEPHTRPRRRAFERSAARPPPRSPSGPGQCLVPPDFRPARPPATACRGGAHGGDAAPQHRHPHGLLHLPARHCHGWV